MRQLYLALSGGGGHAASHAGVLRVLDQEGIAVAGIAGVSGGALVAACWAGGANLEELIEQASRLHPWTWVRGWGGGLLILLLAYGVFFGGAKGLVDPDGYFPYALAGALMMAGAVLVSAAGQHKRIAVSNLADVKPVMTLRQILGEMRDTLSNRAFLWLIFAALFGFVNQGITFSMNNYLLGFFWQFTQSEMVAYVFLLFASMIAAFLIVAPLSAKLGKRDGAILAGAIALLVNRGICLLYTSPIPRDRTRYRMPSSAWKEKISVKNGLAAYQLVCEEMAPPGANGSQG